MRFISIILAVLLANIAIAFAQTINTANMNFERGAIGDTPIGWNISERTIKKGYTIRVSDQAHSGKKSLLFALDKLSDSTNTYDGLVFQSINPAAYLNRTVKFSAFAKGEFADTNAYGFIWIKVYMADNTYLSYPLTAPKMINTPNWTKYEVTAEIPANATEIQFGAILQNKGKIWIDDAEFEDIYNTEFSKLTLSDIQANNLLAFAKLFSAIVYYYPNAQIDSLNIEAFAEYGVQRILKLSESKNLSQELKGIFASIADDIEFSASKKKQANSNSDTSDTIPPSFRLYRGLKMKSQNKLTEAIWQNSKANHRLTPAVLSQIIDVSNLKTRKANFSADYLMHSANINSKAYIAVSALDSNQNTIDLLLIESSKTDKSKNKWIRLKQSYTIPLNAKQLKINLVLDGDAGVLFDNLSCEIDGKELIANGGFEQLLANWAFDERSTRSGYEVIINKSKYKSGEQAAELSVINDQFIKYPQIKYDYQIQLDKNLFATFPKAKAIQLNTGNVNNFIDSAYYYSEFEVPQARIASVIYAWALMDNFALIRDKQYSERIDKLLLTAFKESAAAITKNDLIYTISKVLALFPDNAVRVWSNEQVSELLKGLPINISYIEDKYVITKSLSSDLPAGSQIIKVNQQSIDSYIEAIGMRISASSDEFKRLKAISILKYDYSKSSEVLEVLLPDGNKKTIELKRTAELDSLSIMDYPAAEQFADGTFYIDFRRYNEEDLAQFFKANHSQIRGLVLDMRGYNSISEFFFKFFKLGNLKHIVWQMPYFAEYNAPYSAFHLLPQYVKGNGKLNECKLVVICDESTIGLNESNLYLLQKNQMATCIGQSSSGCPSEVTAYPLPCGLTMSLSYISASDDAGNMLIGNAYVPEIIVNYDISTALQSKDALIEKAKEILLQKITEQK